MTSGILSVLRGKTRPAKSMGSSMLGFALAIFFSWCTMAERDLNIQDVVRMVVANLNRPGPPAQSSSDSLPVSTTTEAELNSAFQLPRGPQHGNSSNACMPSSLCNPSALSRLSGGFSNRQNYSRGVDVGRGRRRRQTTFNRTSHGRFYSVRTGPREETADRVFTKDVCLLPSPSWNRVPRGKRKARLITNGMYVDAWPVLKDWNEASLRQEIQKLFSSVLKDAGGEEVG